MYQRASCIHSFLVFPYAIVSPLGVRATHDITLPSFLALELNGS